MIGQHDLSKLKSVTLVGERCDIPTFKWVEDHLGRQMVNDCYWQTESGSPILSNYLGYQTFK
jgi:propionyl-CoA synthetase